MSAKTIESAMHPKNRTIRIAVGELDGKPVGGWGETEQAMQGILAALPLRADRDYTVGQLIDAVFAVEGADERSSGRYRMRDKYRTR